MTYTVDLTQLRYTPNYHYIEGVGAPPTPAYVAATDAPPPRYSPLSDRGTNQFVPAAYQQAPRGTSLVHSQPDPAMNVSQQLHDALDPPPGINSRGISIPLPHSNGLTLTIPWLPIAAVGIGLYFLMRRK